MEITLQNKCALGLILGGVVLLIFTFDSYFSISAMALIAGGGVIFLIYFEKRWIEHRYLKNGLIFTFAFAAIYGILEYVFLDATWNYWFKLSAIFPSKYLYWVFMALLNFFLVFIFSHKSLALSSLSVLLFAINEDLFYWLTKSIHNGSYVFPVPNWFDQRFPVFGLGQHIPFFPFWPRFYFVGWILTSIMLFILFKDLNDKKFLFTVGLFCACSFLSLLFIPQSYSKITSSIIYFFHKIQHQIIYI